MFKFPEILSQNGLPEFQCIFSKQSKGTFFEYVMVISSKLFVEKEASVDRSMKKWSKWTTWSGTCGVGIRIRSQICEDGYQCPIQLENTKS